MHRFAQIAGRIAFIGACLALLTAASCSNEGGDGPKIIVIDQQAVFRDSLAGKDIARQGVALRDEIMGEVQAEQKAIVSAQKDLTGNSSVYSPAQRQRKVKALEARQNAYPVFEQRKNRILQLSLQGASSQVEDSFRPIVQELIKENDATLVLDKAQIMYAAPTYDFTQEAIKRLNNVLKTVKLVRVNLDAAPDSTAQTPLRATPPVTAQPSSPH